MSERIVSRPSSEAYRDGWDRLWGRKPEEPLRFAGIDARFDPTVPSSEVRMCDQYGNVVAALVNVGLQLPEREEGFYWVKSDGEWTVGKWSPSWGGWEQVAGWRVTDGSWRDCDLDFIGPRIYPPSEEIDDR